MSSQALRPSTTTLARLAFDQNCKYITSLCEDESSHPSSQQQAGLPQKTSSDGESSVPTLLPPNSIRDSTFRSFLSTVSLQPAKYPDLIKDILLLLLTSTCAPLPKGKSVINDTLQSNRRLKGQTKYIFGNSIIRDSDEIANHFNDYFINISRTLSEQIQPVHSFDHYLKGNVTSKFQFNSVIDYEPAGLSVHPPA